MIRTIEKKERVLVLLDLSSISWQRPLDPAAASGIHIVTRGIQHKGIVVVLEKSCSILHIVGHRLSIELVEQSSHSIESGVVGLFAMTYCM
jgi:hypothetical protein